MMTKGANCKKDKEGPHHPSLGENNDSLLLTDVEDRSQQLPYGSNYASSACYEHQSSNASHFEIDGVAKICKKSCISDCSVEIDLESKTTEIKVNNDKVKRDCRICHLSFKSDNLESGIPIILGCSCKEDLATAHKQCAEKWFKIKGNKTCEICGSTAQNVDGIGETEMMNETNSATVPPAPPSETRSFWKEHWLNVLLFCLAFALFLSWRFRFNVAG